jgi:hypothetical protein
MEVLGNLFHIIDGTDFHQDVKRGLLTNGEINVVLETSLAYRLTYISKLISFIMTKFSCFLTLFCLFASQSVMAQLSPQDTTRLIIGAMIPQMSSEGNERDWFSLQNPCDGVQYELHYDVTTKDYDIFGLTIYNHEGEKEEISFLDYGRDIKGFYAKGRDTTLILERSEVNERLFKVLFRFEPALELQNEMLKKQAITTVSGDTTSILLFREGSTLLVSTSKQLGIGVMVNGGNGSIVLFNKKDGIVKTLITEKGEITANGILPTCDYLENIELLIQQVKKLE